MNTNETVCIAGVGHAAPAKIQANSEILKAFPNRTEDEIVRLTGIRERRYAADDESATDLAVIAVQHALFMRVRHGFGHRAHISRGSPEGQRPVVFTETRDPLALVAPNTVTFENAEHDYPQRITYRATEDGLAANISKLDGSRPAGYAWARCKS